MKLNNKFSFLLLGGLLAFSSCKKELDKQPNATFSEANAFQTVDHLQLGVNEAYGRYSAYLNDIYVNSLLSDESKEGAGNAGQGLFGFRWRYTSDATAGGDVTGAFSSYYAMIDQVNNVLEFIPKVNAPAEEARKQVLRGQLLALRAMAHFSLLEFYSERYEPSKLGVAIMTKSDVFAQPKRNTMGEVMAQIEQDLNDAKDLLPATGTFSDTVMNRINVTGFQARVALYKRDYPAAIAHATTVINSGAKTLATGTTYQGIWQDANTAEVLFRRRMATSTSLGALYTTTGNQIYFSPSDKLWNAFTASDIRRNTFIAAYQGNPVVYKHWQSARGGRAVDIKIMRISEMYLIRAEAYARSGVAANLALGTADLNEIRRARITGYVDVTFPTGAALADAVMEERFKELCFEGFRFFDLKRNALPVERDATDAGPGWLTLPANDYRFVLPIPEFQIFANPNTVQNPGYN